ncbi:hypothetical protein QR680_001134 [Steinernema hermaphroditum]|uniref:R3H-associated N-terminal domain-containing protein n=1 Tax=Steinernema hermaphroditum TaxID=289476 RepID=A0AA39LFE4_9BILA|nr:hypothetical protein QR680_001134 [Steinernema hermaphroditum]
MGILRNKDERKLFKVEDEAVAEEQHITYADYVFDETESEHSDNEAPVVPLRESPKRGSHRRAPIKCPLNMLGYDGPRIKSGMGARKLRRLEHNRLLLSLTDPEDICEDLSDMIPETMNAFAHENLEAKSSSSTPCEDTKRARHPAYSGKACFKRMDRRFREILMQKHLPWSFINATEQALIDFFSCDPDGVWISTLNNGNERLYVHAIAQYLSLMSESTTDTTDQRVTEVRNTKSFFVPPRATLLEYVSEHKKNRNYQNANSEF